MNKILLLICTSLLTISCNRSIPHKTIVFDNDIIYPEIDIKLSDVADVKYIKLSYKNAFNQNLTLWDTNLYVDEERGYIYMRRYSEDYKVVLSLFDMEGNLIKDLDKKNTSGSGLIDFYILDRSGEVGVYSRYGENIEIYDPELNYKKTVRNNQPQIWNMLHIKRNKILVNTRDERDGEQIKSVPKGCPYYVISGKSARTIKKFDLDFKSDKQEGFYLATHSFVYGKDGIFIYNTNSDSVMWLDNKTMKITPRLIDNSSYIKPETMARPSFETDKYVFFSVRAFDPKGRMYLYGRPSYHLDRQKHFVYDKEVDQIFQIPIEFTKDSRLHSRVHYYKELLSDKCALNPVNASMNRDYLYYTIPYSYLKKNIDSLPSELKKITESITDRNACVLALIKLK